ncbi:MAG: alpha/beta hydrolase [[Eubacterium] brachy]|nr:alpha/beta hydrolase [[Eubacterium] brachy]
MSAKYTLLKVIAKILRLQNMMKKPYSQLQKKFKTQTAYPVIPECIEEDLDFSTFKVGVNPVLHVKHKAPAEQVCIYLIGGGMLKYPKKDEVKEQIKLARLTGRDMVLPYYPLVPDNSILDVYEMLYQLYKKLIEEYEHENIAIAGGSSGGNLALGLISYINEKGEGIPMPGKIYAASPGTMIYTEEEKRKAKILDGRDLIMSIIALENIQAGMENGREVPEYMRYLQRGDYTGLKEAYLSFGGDEVFSAAADTIAEQMRKFGVDVTLEIGEGMYHMYSMMPLVPEAKKAYQDMIEYLKI